MAKTALLASKLQLTLPPSTDKDKNPLASPTLTMSLGPVTPWNEAQTLWVGLTAGLGFERGTPDADHLKYDHQRVFASATKLWQGGLRGRLGVDLGKRDFVGIYPLTTEARDDSYYKVQFGLSHSQIEVMGFRPTLNCSHTLNRSNVSFYNYRATECQATLNRNF